MGLFCLFAVIQCAYALYFFIRIFSLPTVPGNNQKINKQAQIHPVSIIICAKNEAANLKKNLPCVLAQRYGNTDGKAMYEVIVVNDSSDDDTGKVLIELGKQYDRLRIVDIASDEVKNIPGKKYALSRGVAIASYDRLLLTDADCAPESDQWLEKMVAPLAAGKQIVCGYGGYEYRPGLLNAFVRWETMHTFLQYSTYAMAGLPYMAVGRNMACTKKVLLAAQQSDVWHALPSGDDDLLVSIAGNGNNTAIVCDEQAFTYTDAKINLADWARQKQRHLSTGKYYKSTIKQLLGAYGISHAGLWFCFFVLLFSHYCAPVLMIMGLRCLIYWLIWLKTDMKLRERNEVYLFPLFDIGWMVYNFVFFPYITWKNKKHWK